MPHSLLVFAGHTLPWGGYPIRRGGDDRNGRRALFLPTLTIASQIDCGTAHRSNAAVQLLSSKSLERQRIPLKARVDSSLLPFHVEGTPSARFAAFCETYLRLPNSKPLILAAFQRDLVASVWDAEPRPRLAAWALARGNAKSTLAAAMGVYAFMTGGDDTSVDCVAVDERQAGLVFGQAAKFVMRHPDLASRVQVFKERMVIPSRGSEFACLPASAAALEGRSPDLCICDEGGRIDPEVFEVCALATGKKAQSLILLLGTPGPNPDNVLARFRQHASEHPGDTFQIYREISAARWPHHPTDCDDHDGGPGCVSIANPAIAAGFLHRDGLMSCQPPRMTESHFRRARLVQWVAGGADPVLPPGLWDGLSTCEPIPDGSTVVLGFDGSYNGDTTALVAVSIAPRPHVDVVKVWSRPRDAGEDWTVPVLAVENTIRESCRRWRVKEIVADPTRWARSLEVLAGDGLPVSVMPQTATRMAAATGVFLTAALNDGLTHSGHPVLAAHLSNAVLSDDVGGRLVKASRSRHAGKIDAAVAMVLAFSRATSYQNRPRKRYASFKG